MMFSGGIEKQHRAVIIKHDFFREMIMYIV